MRSGDSSRQEKRARPAQNRLLVGVFHETFETPYLPAVVLAQDELQMEQRP